MVRLLVTLPDEEARGLFRKSGAELRDPREQIRFWVREKLHECGLLDASEVQKEGEEREQSQLTVT